MSIEWYYAQNGQRTGPVSLPEIQMMVKSGQLRPDDLVWTEGMSDWQPLEETEEVLRVDRGGMPPPLPPLAGSTESGPRQWAMILHLSQFAGYAIPLAGLLAPIIIWRMKRDDVPGLDQHGKVVANWIITEIILLVVCAILVFMFIGIPLLFILGLLGIIFPIIGGIKASEGEIWTYPMSFGFFK